MNERIAKARVVDEGAGQMVLLPDAFRLPGPEVQVSRTDRGLLLEPIKPKMSREEIDAILAELNRLAEMHGDFMPDGREQPPMPPDDDIDPID